MKKVAILGSTGSVGSQTMDVLRKNKEHFKVFSIAAYNEVADILSQIEEFKPKIVSIGEEKAFQEVKKKNKDKSVKLVKGDEGLIKSGCHSEVDILVLSTSGICCLPALLKAIELDKKILIANKESLITGGKLIKEALKNSDAQMLSLDSEHSAIFQCLQGENREEIENLIITCSGGPFRGASQKDLQKVTKEKVLNHPVWSMGPKITTDSATLMNKGFEVLEAHVLFDFPLEKIKVVVHPECIIHSMVEFKDGVIKAHLSEPDMRGFIQYALFYPKRKKGFLKSLNLAETKKLSFFEPERDKFPCLDYAFEAGKIGGTMPAALVFADQIAAGKFLKGEIEFLEIPKLIKKILEKHQPILDYKKEDIWKVKEWVEKELN